MMPNDTEGLTLDESLAVEEVYQEFTRETFTSTDNEFNLPIQCIDTENARRMLIELAKRLGERHQSDMANLEVQVREDEQDWKEDEEA